MKTNLFVNLLKNAVGLPTTSSDCCGQPVQSSTPCTCGQAQAQEIAKPCCEKKETHDCSCEQAIDARG